MSSSYELDYEEFKPVKTIEIATTDNKTIPVFNSVIKRCSFLNNFIMLETEGLLVPGEEDDHLIKIKLNFTSHQINRIVEFSKLCDERNIKELEIIDNTNVGVRLDEAFNNSINIDKEVFEQNTPKYDSYLTKEYDKEIVSFVQGFTMKEMVQMAEDSAYFGFNFMEQVVCKVIADEWNKLSKEEIDETVKSIKL